MTLEQLNNEEWLCLNAAPDESERVMLKRDLVEGVFNLARRGLSLEAVQKENLLLKLSNALWNATFSKYESWLANNAPAVNWPEQVVKDYQKCSTAIDQQKGEK